MSTVSGPSDAEPSPGGDKSADDVYAVLRNRDYRLYLIGRFIASFGQQMLTVAVGWEIYERTGNYMALGLVGFVQMLPMGLFTFPAGHLADNYNRKHVLVYTQAAMAIVCLGLAAVSGFKLNVNWMYACLFAMGAARTYMWPSSASFMPQLVPRHQFARAVSWNTGSFQIAAVSGPAAGGFLIAFTHTAAWVYVTNAVASLICLILITKVRAHHPVRAKERFTLASVITGLKFVYRTKIILGTITLDMFAVLFGGATAMLPVYAKTMLAVGPQGLGWLQAALPLGSLLMSIILVHSPPLERAGRTLLWSVIWFGLATVVFGFSRSFWLSFSMLFVCGVADYVSVMVRHTLVQLLTPDEMRGRVSAINSLFIGTSNQLGEFESGTVAAWTNPVFSVVSGGIATVFVVIAVALKWPGIRKYGRLDS